jgi:hypothetical protein
MSETLWCLKCKAHFPIPDVHAVQAYCPKCGTAREVDNLELRFVTDGWGFIYRRVNGRHKAIWLHEGVEKPGPDLTGNDLIYCMADRIRELESV